MHGFYFIIHNIKVNSNDYDEKYKILNQVRKNWN